MVQVVDTQLTIIGESIDYYSLVLGAALMAYALRDVGVVRDGIRLMGIWYLVPFFSVIACSLALIFNGFSPYVWAS